MLYRYVENRSVVLYAEAPLHGRAAMRTSRDVLPNKPRHDTVRVKTMQTREQHRALVVPELGKTHPTPVDSDAHERELELHPAVFRHPPPLDLDESDVQVELCAWAGRDARAEDFAHCQQLLVVGPLARGFVLLETGDE